MRARPTDPLTIRFQIIPIENSDGPSKFAYLHGRGISIGLETRSLLKPDVRESIFSAIREIDPTSQSISLGRRAVIFLYEAKEGGFGFVLAPDALGLNSVKEAKGSIVEDSIEGNLAFHIIIDEETLYDRTSIKLAVLSDFGGNERLEKSARELFVQAFEGKYGIKVILVENETIFDI